MPTRYTIVPLLPAHYVDALAPAPSPCPARRRERRSSIAPPASLLLQPAVRPSYADRKARQLAEALASSSPLPPPPQLHVAALETPGKSLRRPLSLILVGY
jgi:hypothetical protein